MKIEEVKQKQSLETSTSILKSGKKNITVHYVGETID